MRTRFEDDFYRRREAQRRQQERYPENEDDDRPIELTSRQESVLTFGLKAFALLAALGMAVKVKQDLLPTGSGKKFSADD